TSTWGDEVVIIERAPSAWVKDLSCVASAAASVRGCLSRMCSRSLQDDAGDMQHVLLGHGGVIGQEESAMRDPIGHGKTGLSIPVYPERMQAQIPGRKNS